MNFMKRKQSWYSLGVMAINKSLNDILLEQIVFSNLIFATSRIRLTLNFKYYGIYTTGVTLRYRCSGTAH
jgi:hypothetical protein